jgi:hypothetical protein
MLPLPRISATPKTNLAKEFELQPKENKARHAWILIDQVQRTYSHGVDDNIYTIQDDFKRKLKNLTL